MTSEIDSLIFYLGWLAVGLILILLPRFLLSGVPWLSSATFTQEFPEKERLISSYILLSIIWIPLSIVFTARYFQSRDFPVFSLFIVFIPLVGMGLLKGIIEIIFGVSSYLGLKKPPENHVVRFPVLRTGLDFLKMFQYRFAENKERIKPVGVVRVLVNLGILVGLVYFLL